MAGLEDYGTRPMGASGIVMDVSKVEWLLFFQSQRQLDEEGQVVRKIKLFYSFDNLLTKIP